MMAWGEGSVAGRGRYKSPPCLPDLSKRLRRDSIDLCAAASIQGPPRGGVRHGIPKANEGSEAGQCP
jgi:hypothetical protein